MEAADLSAASPCRRTADALSACKISSPAKRHRPAGEAPTPGMRIQSVQAAPSPFERPAPHLFAARSSSAGDEDAMNASRGPFLFGQQFNPFLNLLAGKQYGTDFFRMCHRQDIMRRYPEATSIDGRAGASCVHWR